MATGTLPAPENSRRMTRLGSSANSVPARVNTVRATASPEFAADSTNGKSAEKSGGGDALAMRTRSLREVACQAFSMAASNPGRSPFSCAHNTAPTAVRPIHWPEPSSETANPHPPALELWPLPSRPYANEPVPAQVTTPGPLPKAACSAITVSPTTCTRQDTSSAIMRATKSDTSARPAPEAPTHAHSICAGSTLAATQAWRTAACNPSRARASPSRMTLLPPAVAMPSTDFPSPTAQVVFVAPPSMPR